MFDLSIVLAFQLGPFAIEYPDRLIAQILGFALFALILWKMPPSIPLGIPFLRETLRERSARIAETQSQVENALADVQRLHDDYAARLRSIEQEARHRIEEAVREAEVAREEIITEAQQSAQLIRRRAEEEIARESARQRTLLRRQIVQSTLEAAEEAVRAHAGEQVQRLLITDFIASVGKNGPTQGVAVAPTPPSGMTKES